MNRKAFISSVSAGALALSLGKVPRATSPVNSAADKYALAYYFRAHMYTLVPRQVREDLDWMSEIGTRGVAIALLEQDLHSAVENVNFIAREARARGMELFLVPSRWAGILAGAPKVPSVFSVQNPQTWVLKADGKPLLNKWSGVFSSIHAPETKEFFKDRIRAAVNLFDFQGWVWDEPKLYTVKDYSQYARESLADVDDPALYAQAFSSFFSEMNQHLSDLKPSAKKVMFIYANLPDAILATASETRGLDYFGCDGRPWRNEDGGDQEQANKVLLGAGERFIPVARKNGQKTFWLIENHNMSRENNALMEARFQEVIDSDIDMMAYYYYPRNVNDPDANMAIVRRYMKKYCLQ